MPKELTKIKGLIARALARTEALWPDIKAAYEHIWSVAQILKNESALSGAAVREQVAAALEAMAPQAGQSDWLKQALAEFVKVTASYWPGLFHGYDVAGLGRTNNGLEQFFGSWRWHERRAGGPATAAFHHAGRRQGLRQWGGEGGDPLARRPPGHPPSPAPGRPLSAGSAGV